jgi:hypothetical protein
VPCCGLLRVSVVAGIAAAAAASVSKFCFIRTSASSPVGTAAPCCCCCSLHSVSLQRTAPSARTLLQYSCQASSALPVQFLLLHAVAMPAANGTVQSPCVSALMGRPILLELPPPPLLLLLLGILRSVLQIAMPAGAATAAAAAAALLDAPCNPSSSCAGTLLLLLLPNTWCRSCSSLAAVGSSGAPPRAKPTASAQAQASALPLATCAHESSRRPSLS